MSYHKASKSRLPVVIDVVAQDRPGRHAEDDYEQMWLLAHAPATRHVKVRALDESYIFTRLLQGRVPNELVDALKVRCPDAFRAAAFLDAPTAPSERRQQVHAFITAWHTHNGLDIPCFDQRIHGMP